VTRWWFTAWTVWRVTWAIFALAKAQGKYKGGQFKLTDERAAELRRRAATGENTATQAREFCIARQSLHSYMKVTAYTTH